MLLKYTVSLAFAFFSVSTWAGEFFPEGVFFERADRHQSKVTWYGKHLRAMNEPSLFELRLNKDMRVYRFLWLRTFDNPISVRLIVNDDSSGRLIAKVTSGAGGYEPGDVTEEIVKPISAENVLALERALEDLDFWDLPTTVEMLLGTDRYRRSAVDNRRCQRRQLSYC